jgi:hypothetical protein
MCIKGLPGQGIGCAVAELSLHVVAEESVKASASGSELEATAGARRVGIAKEDHDMMVLARGESVQLMFR